jgi:hypothetical protein
MPCRENSGWASSDDSQRTESQRNKPAICQACFVATVAAVVFVFDDDDDDDNEDDYNDDDNNDDDIKHSFYHLGMTMFILWYILVSIYFTVLHFITALN